MRTGDLDLRGRLAAFIGYRQEYLDGDEKGEAQIFCDRLFQAFGHAGVKEAGAVLEYRLKKNDDGGTSFADLVFKPRCLIEMKKAGVDLAKHFRQAFDYWVRAVPDRPRYVVLCNFDEFWIYDFDRQLDEPVDKVAIVDLTQRWEALAFLLPDARTPVFGNDLVEVTRDAASRVAAVFRAMTERGVDRVLAQRFVLQCVMAMFAEDVGLLPRKFFTEALADSPTGRHAYDLIFGLFREMNMEGRTTGGRFEGTPYFNGGLFAKVDPLTLSADELELLRSSSATDWSAVRPEIFGTLFEQSMDEKQRHALGAHFTSQADIARVVGPTIVQPWRERLSEASSIQELEGLIDQMHAFRVLDPACGSGNFLYVAYREMRRLEHEALTRIEERRRSGDKAAQSRIAYVSPDHFLGMDVNEFAVEIAKVTLLLGKKLASNELGDEQAVLPLDNLDATIVCRDALFTKWPAADAIIGNPPYLGRRKMVEELGSDYCARLAESHPEVRGVSDFVSYWFPLAHDHLPAGGRAGFVATKTIRQGDTRKVTLDRIVGDGGTITEAVDAIPWPGDAAVTVSIVNWLKGEPPADSERVLWLDQGDRRLLVSEISTSLSPRTDLKSAVRLKANASPKRVFQGQTPGVTAGFELSRQEAAGVVRTGADRSVIHPFLGGNELLKETTVERWIIDVPEDDADTAWRNHPEVMRHLSERVLPIREAAAKKEREANKLTLQRNPKAIVNWHHRNFLSTWWRLGYRREDMLAALQPLDRYIAITRTSSEKRGPVFTFVDSTIRLGDTAVAFSLSDDYSFGILQSATHRAWFEERCTTLETRLNYTSRTVFDGFPWPQEPSESAAAAVAAAAAEIIELRARALEQGATLAMQYDVLRQPGKSNLRSLHVKLDRAVSECYGFEPDEDVLAQLLSLNLSLADRERSGATITPPGSSSTHMRVSDWSLPAPDLL